MPIALSNPTKQFAVLATALLLTTLYVTLAAVQFAAAHLSDKLDLGSLRLAVRLQPGNAEYHYRLGRYQALILESPESAISSYQYALKLNPHAARYWLDLAAVYQSLGNENAQQDAMTHALRADPATPNVAWETANLYLVQGDIPKALQQFRVVLESDPYLPPAALQLCWRVNPDIDSLLRDVLPHNSGTYAVFLDILVSKGETAAAAKVWDRLAHNNQPVERHHVFDYIHYLLSKHEVEQARLVWRQAADIAGLSHYQPSYRNLVVNANFAQDVLNGGFDWLYQRSPEVKLAVDPTDSHSGARSVSITFDSRGLSDAGIAQLIPVDPNTPYDFSAYFKAQDLEAAGGPRFALSDVFSGAVLYASDILQNTDTWRGVSGTFTTSPKTDLLVLAVQRFPPGGAIKGRLWIDDFRLAETRPEPSGSPPNTRSSTTAKDMQP